MKRLTLLIALFLIATNVLAQELYSLGATAFDRENANFISETTDDMAPLSTDASFEGGVSVNGSDFKSAGMYINDGPVSSLLYTISPSDMVEIVFRIIPDSTHLGQMTDILVTAGYIDFQTLMTSALSGAGNVESVTPLFFMLDQYNNVLLLPEHWGGDILLPFASATLQTSQDILLYRGHLESGALFINCYYRLSDGTIVFNRDIMSIVIMPNLFDFF